MFVRQACSFFFFNTFLLRADRLTRSGSRFFCWLIQLQQRCSPKLKAINGTKSSAAGNRCTPGWWLIPSICLTPATQCESLFLSTYTFHPVTPTPPDPPSEEQRSPSPPCGATFLGQHISSVAGEAFAPTRRQRALRIYHAVPYRTVPPVSFYFWAM